MNAWTTVSLNESGLPALKENEDQIIAAYAIGIYDDDKKTKHDDGTAKLTSHRIFWYADSNKSALSLALSDIESVLYIRRHFNKSPKIQINIGEPYNANTKLSFRKEFHVEFHDALMNALARQKWLETNAGTKTGTSSNRVDSGGFSTKGAGIAGIMKKREEQVKETDDTMKEAFSDLSALIVKANDMVKLAERLQGKMSKNELSEDDQVQFKKYLIELGVVAPVTKSSVGNESDYIKQLGQEISQFMVKPLEDKAGSMTLTNAYCLYNRARGQQLISPDDLLAACKYLNSVQLPVIMRTFKSGVHVLQLRSMTDEAIITQCAELFKLESVVSVDDCICFSVSEFANQQELPLNLAQDHLEIAERGGVICRDETIEGIKFYTNLFAIASF